MNSAIIVIGASAGGVEALQRLLAAIEPDLPATIFIVLHTTSASQLPATLRRHSSLAITYAINGQHFGPNVVLVAPPDLHLLLDNHHTLLSHGPKQNHVRPAIDALFTSAARRYGARTIGVVLSGMLDDGCAGLVAIRQAGGITLVQDPADAIHPDLPRNAIAAGKPDFILAADALGRQLNHLARAHVRHGAPKKKRSLAVATKRARTGTADPTIEPRGKRSRLTCPECGGTLWEAREGKILRFLCHTGHGYSAESMADAQGQEVERALWTALRAVKERAVLCTKLASRFRHVKPWEGSDRYEREAKELTAQAAVIRDLLLHRLPAPRTTKRKKRG